MNHETLNSEDPFDRAIASLRDAAAPGDPPSNLVASTTEAMERESQTTPFQERVLTMLWKTRYPGAAAAVLFVAVIGWLTLGRTSGAFADVIENIRKAQSLRFEVEFQDDGQREQAEMIAKGARYKKVYSNGMVTIADGEIGKHVTLNAATKTATISVIGKNTDRPIDLLLQHVERIAAAKTENLGAKEVDGQPATGFRAHIKDVGGESVVTAWIHAKSNLPIRLEWVDPKTGQVELSMHGFTWNPDIDDSEFNLMPPAGYGVHEPARAPYPQNYDNLNGNDIVESLRLWGTYNSNTFPESYDFDAAMRDYRVAREEKKEFGKMSVLGKMSRGLNYARQVQRSGGEWHYAGKGVKLGEADKPVAWWKVTKEAPMYRVLYGDLTVKDVKPEDLPKPADEE